MFTPNYVFWTMDSHEPQYLIRCSRDSKKIDMFPIINGALWHSFSVSINGKTLYLISSNSEGAHFDNKNRVYGISLENESPRVYELVSSRSLSKYDQLFPIYVRGKIVYLYDIYASCMRRGKIEIVKKG